MMDFSQNALVLNAAIFVGAGAVVWFAGARLVGYVNALSARTGIGQAVIGLMLLGLVTSLPEISVTTVSAASGAADMAVNNLFGSIAFQILILAIIDFAIGKRALTAIVPDPRVILQGALNILMLTLATAAMVVGDAPILGIGAWAWAALVGYVFCIYVMTQPSGHRRWIAAEKRQSRDRKAEKNGEQDEHGDLSMPGLILRIVAFGAAILAAGYVLSQTGSALTEQTGLAGGFFGFVLLAMATSLPEFSTALSAARRGLFTMAISDILGTNLINVALVFLVDAVAAGDPVLGIQGRFAIFGALLGMFVTTLFVVGISERGDKTVARMGFDSIGVLLAYAAGLVGLFYLQGEA